MLLLLYTKLRKKITGIVRICRPLPTGRDSGRELGPGAVPSGGVDKNIKNKKNIYITLVNHTNII